MKKIVFILTFLLSSIVLSAQTSYQGLLGYGISPEGHPYSFDSIVPFFQEVAGTCDGGVVFGNGLWRDDVNSSGKLPGLAKLVSLQQPIYGYHDMINLSWNDGHSLTFNVPGDTTNLWTNSTAQALYLQTIISAADSLQPEYLLLGNEIDGYFEEDSLDYINFTNFLKIAYDSVKAHSPTTKVGTVINYEHTSGNGVNTGFLTPYWGAVDLIDTNKIDFLGVTVYPFFQYNHADSIPLNYLDPLWNRIGNVPMIITETGWPADSFIGGWHASPQEQVDFVDWLFNAIDGKNVEAVNWLFLNYALDTSSSAALAIFRSVALRDSLGNDQPALSNWLANCPQPNFISQTEVSDLTFAPNPLRQSQFFELNSPTKTIKSVHLFDATGKCLEYWGDMKSNSLIAQMEGNTPGLYLMKIEFWTGESHSVKIFVID